MTHLSVLINGSPSNEFHMNKGPLSPFLFNIVVRVTSFFFVRARENKPFSEVNVSLNQQLYFNMLII
jgi:hypothetical protein